MTSRRLFISLLLVLLLASCLHAASMRTPNFVVEAPTSELTQQIGQYAERYRKEKALLWLGRELPPWREPCPLKVTVTNGGAGGATSFAFDQGRVLGRSMHIEGSTNRLLESVLPHEITHTVFADQFRRPVPRWADEGGAVLSEDDSERKKHDQMCREILNGGRMIPLQRLFSLTNYPNDVMCLYAEGYCVTNFLVNQGGRARFLSFVGTAMNNGDWDGALRSTYSYQGVADLEKAWLQHMRDTKGNPLLAGSERTGGTLQDRTPGVSVTTLPASGGTISPIGGVPAPSNPSAPLPPSQSGADPRIMAALSRIENKLTVIDSLQADMVNTKARLDRLEKAMGLSPLAPVAWNDPPQRMDPLPQTGSQTPGQSSFPRLAQPQPYVPAEPLGSYLNIPKK